jgi:hypothetical protein
MDHFKELIKDLQKVKSKKDITDDLVAHLMRAAFGAQMSIFARNSNPMSPQEAFEMTRMICLRELDYLLLEIMDGDDFDDDDLSVGTDPNFLSPMDDPQLKADIQKAMEAYNARLGKG